MKQVTANSVGSCWRADVFTAATDGVCEIVDLDGARLGTLTTSKDSLNRVFPVEWPAREPSNYLGSYAQVVRRDCSPEHTELSGKDASSLVAQGTVGHHHHHHHPIPGGPIHNGFMLVNSTRRGNAHDTRTQ